MPVAVEIEGDHVVAAVWRGPPAPVLGDVPREAGTAAAVDRDHRARTWRRTVDSLRAPRLIEVAPALDRVLPGRVDQPDLRWSAQPVTDVVTPQWSPSDEQVHVSHDGDALLVHVSGSIGQAFRVVSKNSPPAVDEVRAPLEVPYSQALEIIYQAPVAPGSIPLAVEYVDRVTTEGTGLPVKHSTTATILGAGRDYTLRIAGNQMSTMDPDVVPLVSPLFFQDSQHTFYVEPALTETTLEDYDDWAISSVTSQVEFDPESYWDRLDLFGQVARQSTPDRSTRSRSVARYQIEPRADWAIRARRRGRLRRLRGRRPDSVDTALRSGHHPPRRWGGRSPARSGQPTDAARKENGHGGQLPQPARHDRRRPAGLARPDPRTHAELPVPGRTSTRTSPSW